jgi:lipoprotein NlpI
VKSSQLFLCLLSFFSPVTALAQRSATDYLNRGNAKYNMADYEGAIADCSKAIQLDPKLASAYITRGAAKRHKGDYDGAIADYDKAIQLDPEYAPAYNNRGIAKRHKGDYDAAIADLDKDTQLDPKDVYPHLYLWLLRVRQGQTAEATAELAAFLDKQWDASPGAWTSKIAGFLLDKVTEPDLFAAVSSSDPIKDREQHCQAWYYSGIKHLLSGDKGTAGDYFRKCLATEQFDVDEYQLAQVELKALGSN